MRLVDRWARLVTVVWVIALGAWGWPGSTAAQISPQIVSPGAPPTLDLGDFPNTCGLPTLVITGDGAHDGDPTWNQMTISASPSCEYQPLVELNHTGGDDPLTTSVNSVFVGANGDISLANGRLSIARSTGRVGIGTTAPQGHLHIGGAPTQDLFLGMGPDLVNGPALNFGYSGWTFGRGSGFFNVRPDPLAAAPNPSLRFATGNVQRMIITSAGNVGLGVTLPLYPLQAASGAHVTAGGVWRNASSREVKQDVAPLAEAAARAALLGLAPVTYVSRADPTERHVGFIAEDAPELVAAADRTGLSPMDLVAVLTRLVQEQERAIAELRARLEALEPGGRP
jgi:hypothetical protein